MGERLAANRWSEKLSPEKLKEMYKKYKQPLKCEAVRVSHINPEIWSQISLSSECRKIVVVISICIFLLVIGIYETTITIKCINFEKLAISDSTSAVEATLGALDGVDAPEEVDAVLEGLEGVELCTRG